MEDLTRETDWSIEWKDPRDVPVTRRQARRWLRELRDESGSVVTDEEIEGWLDDSDEQRGLENRRLGFELRLIEHAVVHPGVGDNLRLTLVAEVAASGLALSRIRQAQAEGSALWVRVIPPRLGR